LRPTSLTSKWPQGCVRLVDKPADPNRGTAPRYQKARGKLPPSIVVPAGTKASGSAGELLNPLPQQLSLNLQLQLLLGPRCRKAS
jgi:hypothetical protein